MSRTTLHFQLLLLWYCKYFLTYQEPSSLSFRWQKFLWMNLFPWLSLYHLGILFCVFVPDQNPLKFWNYYYSLYRKLQLDDKPHPKQFAATATAKSLQLCPTLCDPIDGSPPGSSVPGILQARILEWLPFPSPTHESEKWKWSRSVVCDSVRPHGLQPTRLLHPWDFPGKSTGVGCHCLLRLNNLPPPKCKSIT